MEVTVEQVSPLTRKLKIVVPEAEVAKEMEAAYRKLKGEVQLKGYRRGKVPRTILEKSFGDRIKQEVGEKLVQASYFDAVEKEKLDPVVHPEIRSHDFVADGTFRYEAEVDVRPGVELKQYKGVEIEKPEIVVAEAEIDRELERMRLSMAPLRTVEDRTIQKQDLVVVDFQGYYHGEPVKQARGEDLSVDVGSGRQGKEFEEQLVGLRKGEEASRTVDFPEGHSNPILAGKSIEFRFVIKDVKERLLPELNDEFARDVDGQFKSLDDLRSFVRGRIERAKGAELDGELSDRLMRRLIEENEFEVPERLVKYEIQEYLKEMEANLQRSGMTFESAGINLQEAGERHREVAVKRVRGDFILKKVAELEAIKLTEAEIEAGFTRVARQYNMSVPEVKGFFKRREDMLPFLNELLNEKILAFLREQAEYKMVPAVATDLPAESLPAGDTDAAPSPDEE